MRLCAKFNRKSGLSLLEAMIVLAATALLLGNIAMVQTASGDAHESSIFSSALEDQAETTMDRIALAIMSTSIEDLDDVLSAPSFVSSIDYEVVTDVVDGQPIVGTPERIEFDMPRGRVIWKREPDSDDELEVTWAKYVPGLLEGEEPNGIDDNGNGMEDESGLAFNLNIKQITVRLTLRRVDSNGIEYTKTRSRRVTCRN
ncbi:MAG: hypothetical protein ACI8X5_001258 [Planctomycetota bacterium]|jgi:hypothetical protein